MNKRNLLVGLALLGQAIVAEPTRPGVILPMPRPPVVAPPVITRTFHLSAQDLAREVDTLLATAKMKLNNRGSQSSFVELRGVQFGFQIPRTTVDIDCGTFCPDLGDGHFYVNDVNLERADFALRSSYFELMLDFEDAGREIKGYHSVLGDNGMPDFEMNRPYLKLVAQPVVVNGQVSLTFSNARLTSDTQSTGGCNIGGVDICNKIFGTDRKIEKGVESASQSALNGGLVQSALRLAIRQYLQSKGITASVRSVRLVGGDLQVTIN